ncbi:integrase core domain-containing protein [Streptomyces sp. AC558_RSS880]|uniref:integrase core domain-containing protein n=2 Tax=unclassified Streptomyces TaxID=2593676 RepID=UPI0035B4A07E
MIYSSTHRGRWHLRQVVPGVSTSSSALHLSASRISHRERGHEDTERLRQSMSAVGTSADDALAESFNATLQHETLRGARRFDGALACRLTVFRWTTRYNARRRHSANGHQAPIAYEQVSTPRGQGPITSQRPWLGGQPEMPLRHGLAEVISSFRDLRAAARLDAVD